MLKVDIYIEINAIVLRVFNVILKNKIYFRYSTILYAEAGGFVNFKIVNEDICLTRLTTAF